MTQYKSDIYKELLTYDTAGAPIRFINGVFTATTKAQRDALDANKRVKRVEQADAPKPVAKDTTTPKTTATKPRTSRSTAAKK